jgi:hypothetical protein
VPQMASQMVISGANLNSRPVAEPAEILEAAPGLAVVQHSGSGKANQYYLRGYNLDHGTETTCRSTCPPTRMAKATPT